MMTIRILCVNANKADYIASAVADFLQKIRPLAKIDMEYIRPVKGSMADKKIRDLESQTLLSKLRPDEYSILLDVRGKRLDTLKASDIFSRIKDYGSGKICFILGGAYGIDSSLRDKVQEAWSLSDFTLSHQIARVVLLEQIYRCLTLLGGIPYHK